MTMVVMRLLCACALLIVSVPFAHGAEVRVAEGEMVMGRSLELELVGDQGDEGEHVGDVELHVTYYPGSEVTRSELLCTTDASGRCEATMRFAGVVVVSTEDDAVSATQRFSVRYARLPMGALAIFIAAGAVLFGGLAFGVQRMQRDED